jgi:peptidoglycan/xylan/chitin deacetylase (PgdA/CDA1 family)
MKSEISACQAEQKAEHARLVSSLTKEISTRARGKSLLLSFDDGPEPISALLSILATLRANGIAAEFYIQGNEVAGNENKLRMIVSQGHTLQNHSWSHSKLNSASRKKVNEELTKTQEAIKGATGLMPTKIRPPYGAGGFPGNVDRELAEVAGRLSLRINNWDIDTRDWEHPKGLGEKELAIFTADLKRANKNPIRVLLHVLPGTARDLPAFIQQLRTWGFTFDRPSP